MDASASKSQSTKSFYFHLNEIEDVQSRRNTYIKYTKLPDYDFFATTSINMQWPRKKSYVLQPHLRQIIQLNEEERFGLSPTSQSITTNPRVTSSATYSKRKIVTLVDNPKNINSPSVISARKEIVAAKSKIATPISSKLGYPSPRTGSPHRNPFGRPKQQNMSVHQPHRISAKLNLNNGSDDVQSVQKKIPTYKGRLYSEKNDMKDNLHTNNVIRNRGKSTLTKNPNTSKIGSKRSQTESEIKVNVINEEMANIIDVSDSYDISNTSNNKNEQKVTKVNELLTNFPSKTIKSQVIRISREKITGMKRVVIDKKNKHIANTLQQQKQLTKLNDVEVQTGTIERNQVDAFTDVERKSCEIQTENLLQLRFDRLDIPNVTLVKDSPVAPGLKDSSRLIVLKDTPCVTVLKNSPSVTVPEDVTLLKGSPGLTILKESPSKKRLMDDNKNRSNDTDVDVLNLYTRSLSDLQAPSVHISHRNKVHRRRAPTMVDDTPLIRATLTYETKQEIDFKVVANTENNGGVNTSPTFPIYPMNIVSVYRNDVLNNKTNKPPSKQNKDNENETSLVDANINKYKFVKPSELIRTIKVDNDLQDTYICEQFQRELNFIDSFFESLQYLENCSLSNKHCSDSNVENLVTKSGFDVNNSDYEKLFSKFDDGTNDNDTEAMASKSLCLLNLLIRDEQRRAKNLLFVLKMREDALKDFTKSQILWLENKKRHENTDISTLKKKQRGALLKLQHECGEMQRMRKAFLALSEKRKIALMKTKKNIELMMKDSVSEQLIIGKKKLKRNSVSERPAVPLKCFDLSSSGCEDSSTSRPKTAAMEVGGNTNSVEKSIQTGESIRLIDSMTDTAAEHFVTVDGSYLNILFNNLKVPEIFSSGKQYEVNEEALRNVVHSANNTLTPVNETDLIDKFIDQIKNREQDGSTTPSTARSLVEEFDQYYKGLTQDDEVALKTITSESGPESSNSTIVDQSNGSTIKFNICHIQTNTENDLREGTVELGINTDVTEIPSTPKQICSSNMQTGLLSVPSAAEVEINAPDLPADASLEVLMSNPTGNNITLHYSGLPLPVNNEAEELRRQQLAIEREIKALEQEQSQFLVVREIPDKPPPPYIPPQEPRVARPASSFQPDGSIEEKVAKQLSCAASVPVEAGHAFDLFLQDFCVQAVQTRTAGDKPWEAGQPGQHAAPADTADTAGLVREVARELEDVLKKEVTPVVVPGVGSRRTDSIDDILFTEWRRYETEWTNLHAHESHVKNEMCESIFQFILFKTIEDYKKVVCGKNTTPGNDNDKENETK